MTKLLVIPQPHKKSEGARWRRGVLVFALLALSACASGSGDSPTAKATPGVTPPVTKQITFTHGLGFVCWFSENPVMLWCWASEQAALDNGDAPRVGITSLVPVLLWTQPSTSNEFLVYDHGLCFGVLQPNGGGTLQTCVGNTASGTVNVWTETVDCFVTGSDSVTCGSEANQNLTFAGLNL